MLRKILPVVALFACSVTASAQVTLQHKYVEGTTYSVETESKTDQTLTLAGMNIDTSSTTFVTSKKSVGQRAADGTLKVEEKITSLRSEISLPGGMSLNFDSGNPNKEASNPALEPILDIFRAVSRLAITVELDAKDKVVKVTLPEGEFEKLPEQAKDRLSPEALKKDSEQAVDFLPDGAVKVGDTWERSSESNLGGGQILSFRTKFEYMGTVDKDGSKFDKITAKVLDVNYSLNGNSPLQVTKSDLKPTSSEIAYLFNREGGHLSSKASKIRIQGPLTLVVNNMEFEGSVDLKIEENVTRQK